MKHPVLNTRIQFLRSQSIDNGVETAFEFQAEGPVYPAMKSDVSDSERWRAGEEGSLLTSRFVVRESLFTRSITTRDQLQHGNYVYEIVGIKELSGRSHYLEISAAIRKDVE